MELITFGNAKNYLRATKQALERYELENNLLLGICNHLLHYKSRQTHHRFINVVTNHELKASMILTPFKAVLAYLSETAGTVRYLADYCKQTDLSFKALVGPSKTVEIFVETLSLPLSQKKILYLYNYKTQQDDKKVIGKLVKAGSIYLDQLFGWAVAFYEQVNLFPRKSTEEIYRIIVNYIEGGDLYCLLQNGAPVTMAAVIRKTDNIAFIGMVYTPVQLRGNGYATACVEQLSKHLISDRYTSCGLFTEEENATSNKIYQAIGYQKRAEFLDVEFA